MAYPPRTTTTFFTPIPLRVPAGNLKHTEIGLEKRCTKCGDWFPADTQFFNTHHKDGLHSWCRACSAANWVANRNYYERNRRGLASERGSC